MNYRHAYHAGNFADVVKHIILTRVIAYMQRKDAGFAVIDTHAGIGRYDLSGEQAQKTGEWRGGIGQLLSDIDNAPADVAALLADYLRVIASFNPAETLETYPGSPRIAHRLRRPQDRIAAIELHDADFKHLKREFAGAHGIKVFHLDGWTGLKAQLPPKERRGIVLIDPPFESRDEFSQIAASTGQALKRFASGTYCLWYPLKNRAAVADFKSHLAALEVPYLIAELTIKPPAGDNAPGLFGTGMAIINPPFVLEGELKTIFSWLTPVLEVSPGAGAWHVEHCGPAL